MSSLEAIWALEVSPDLTDDERADAIANLKAAEWSAIVLPITVGSVTITDVRIHGSIVEFTGDGGSIDWPLHLVNAPIAILDPTGTDVDALGRVWRVDVNAVLTDLIWRLS